MTNPNPEAALNRGDLHEISLAIGELRSDVKTLFHKQDELAKRLSVQLDRLDAIVNKDIKELDRLKNRGWGILIGLSLAAGSAGAWLSNKAAAVLAALKIAG